MRQYYMPLNGMQLQQQHYKVCCFGVLLFIQNVIYVDVDIKCKKIKIKNMLMKC